MNKLAMLLPFLLLSCAEPMTSEAIVAEMKVCQDAGFKSQAFKHGVGGSITHIQCKVVADD